MQCDAASFRDPAGRVYRNGDRILRTVTIRAAPDYELARDSGALRAWIDRGWVIDTKEVAAPADAGPDVRSARYLLEHARVPFISYPYEWSFALLKAAALLHLDLQIDALNRDLQLSDASAYNVQFIGARPVFIDVLSFQHYQTGDYWAGHRQFCEQFLNPLLLRAALGIPHNAWLRGSPEGIPAAELDAALPFTRKLSLNVFSHVTLPARLARKSAATPMTAPTATRRPLPRSSYAGLLEQLRHWIAKLRPGDATPSVWREYGDMRTYTDEARDRKHAFVRDFIAATRPAMLWDLGCNTGEYAALALQAGAGYVVGFDADHGALDVATDRATSSDLRFLPLFLDAANPAPDQGWNQRERPGLQGRAGADALLALALVHHLAIARNIPLDAFAGWLTGLAPTGIVEFVPKEDPTVKLMLASRTDIFDAYHADAFEAALASHARIVRAETISAAGRRLYQFERA